MQYAVSVWHYFIKQSKDLKLMLPGRFELTLKVIMPERIYNPITTTEFSAVFTLRGKHCQHPIAAMGVVDKFEPCPYLR